MCVQLVWLVRELVKSGIMGADGVLMTLLKQVAGQCGGQVWFSTSNSLNSDFVCVCVCPAGGDISSKNLWLAESVLDILLEQKYV